MEGGGGGGMFQGFGRVKIIFKGDGEGISCP